LEEFAYITSHDLRTPLRQVASFLGLLKHRYAGHMDEKADHYIAQAISGAEKMYDLIEDVLSFSRVGFAGMSLEELDGDRVLSKSLMNLQTEIEASGAEITSSGLPLVVGDETQLIQLFQNLIGNALKYRIEEEPPRIQVSAVQRQEAWEFRVKDNGIGFDPQYEEKIFQIFQRLHRDTEFPGTGIGLAICKKIVEQHGGRIWAQSVPGDGSTFFFTIPAKRTV
jgi:two-component system, chemotaxis family, sensor kinase Cph1